MPTEKELAEKLRKARQMRELMAQELVKMGVSPEKIYAAARTAKEKLRTGLPNAEEVIKRAQKLSNAGMEWGRTVDGTCPKTKYHSDKGDENED